MAAYSRFLWRSIAGAAEKHYVDARAQIASQCVAMAAYSRFL